MQRYNRIKEDKTTYILDVTQKKDDETLIVTFGDGHKHTDVENTDANLQKLESIMEEQMKDAIKREAIYKIRTLIATGSVLATSTGSIALIGSESMQSIQANEFLTASATILGFGASIIWFIREHSRISELAKVKYRDQNIDKFANIESYTHALDSSSNSMKRLFEESPNPLGMLNIGQYKKSDLTKIIKEMEREETLKEKGITYIKRK